MSQSNSLDLHTILVDYRINVDKMKPAQAYEEAHTNLEAWKNEAIIAELENLSKHAHHLSEDEIDKRIQELKGSK